MKLLRERGIDELAAMSMDEVEASKLTKDDIDMRLKWLGFFHRRKHQCQFSPYLFLWVVVVWACS